MYNNQVKSNLILVVRTIYLTYRILISFFFCIFDAMQSFRPQGLGVIPPAVKYILIINVALFLITQLAESSGINLENYLAIFYPASAFFLPTQFVTHMFMHGSTMHLFSNMFALFIFGSVLEQVWGTKRFLTFYFFCGVGAALVHLGMQWWELSSLQSAIAALGDSPTYDVFIRFYNKNIAGKGYSSSFMLAIENIKGSWANAMDDTSYYQKIAPFISAMTEQKINVPTVGASGAVFGMLLAFGMMFPNTEIYIYFLFPIKAKYLVALYGAFELYSAMQNNPEDNVAHYAHLGGMLFGFILLTYWNKTKKNKLF